MHLSRFRSLTHLPPTLLRWSSYTEAETIPYRTFEQLLNAGQVAEVTVRTESVEGVLNEPLPSGRRAFYAVGVDL